MKYNTPPDLIKQIQVLQRRIEQLERAQKTTSLSVAQGVSQALWLDGGSWPTVVNSTSFVNAFYIPFVYTAPTPVVVFEAVCSDGTTSGEYRLGETATTSMTGVNGATIPPLSIPLGTTSATVFTTDQNPNYWDDYPIGTQRFIRLHVRRTAGAGTISVRMYYMYQKAS